MNALSSLFSPYAVGVAARVDAQINGIVLIMMALLALYVGAFGSYAIPWAVTVIITTLICTGICHVMLRTKDCKRNIDTFFWLQLSMGTLEIRAALTRYSFDSSASVIFSRIAPSATRALNCGAAFLPLIILDRLSLGDLPELPVQKTATTSRPCWSARRMPSRSR